jgi:Zn ribbon nucleic-acid-binding protein
MVAGASCLESARQDSLEESERAEDNMPGSECSASVQDEKARIRRARKGFLAQAQCH